MLKTPKRWESLEICAPPPYRRGHDHDVSILAFRLRSRASLELELIALRHQVSVLRRQHPDRLRLFSTDRLLWVWLYRVWPQILNAMVLVKPAPWSSGIAMAFGPTGGGDHAVWDDPR
jgi:hypothetical protein